MAPSSSYFLRMRLLTVAEFAFSSAVDLDRKIRNQLIDLVEKQEWMNYRLNPRKRNWSQIQAMNVLMSMPGTLNAIHEAKFNPRDEPYNLEKLKKKHIF